MRVCSDACRTAVETITGAGLDAWYDLRTHSDAQGATTADPRHRAELDAWRVPEVEAALLKRDGRGNDRDDGRCNGQDDGRGGGDDDSHAAIGQDGGRGDDRGDRDRGDDNTANNATSAAVSLTVEGMRCAGCAWLVERLLVAVPGVSAAAVDFPLRRAEVRFDPRAVRLHPLLETLARAGYRATPYSMHAEETAIESERRTRIRGLGISALFGMQVMLLSIALYASEGYGGMSAGFEQLFRWLAMMLTVPVLAWPGRAFFTGAVAALRHRSLTMDVPVALGLAIAFAGSTFATVTGEGEIWFDSVVMFVTLLNAARYLELLARRQATATIRALARSAPLVATRIRAAGAGDGTAPNGADLRTAAGNNAGGGVRLCTGGDKPLDPPHAIGTVKTGGDATSHPRNPGSSRAMRFDTGRKEGDTASRNDDAGDDNHGGNELPETERVPAAALRLGDRVRVRPGEVVPADGAICSGRSAFDESLLTGESNPVARAAGDRVLAGSVNGSGVVEVEVVSAGDETVLGGVLRRAEQAARERPAIAELADRAAAWFIGGVLVLATGVAVAWLLHDASRMIPVLVSVLVVTCPCALSLATPAAMTAALGALARAGLIATRANAVERLALATHCLADKTGTLTEGRFRLRSVTPFSGATESQCLTLAAALERYATHPAAAALVAAAESAGGETGGEVGGEVGVEVGDEARGEVGGEVGGGVGDEAGGEAGDGAGDGAGGEGKTDAIRRVEEPDVQTDGVTGRIDGIRHAVGSPDFVARACGLDPDTFGLDAAGSEAPAPSAHRGTPETVGPSATRTAAPEAHEPVAPAPNRAGDRENDPSACAAAASAPSMAGSTNATESDSRGPVPPAPNVSLAAYASNPEAHEPVAPAPNTTGDGENDPGATHVFLAREGALLARFALADTLRPGARALVEGLRGHGIGITIASGDSAAAVERVARTLGVAHHFARLSPEEKLGEAARLSARGERVLMLGDGVNDTPALAGAHVSVAMGRGAAAAAARADAVLIGDDPGRLLAALDIARHARRIVKQNLAWALGYNLVALPLAATGVVPPWAAAIGMSLSSLAVAGNALRLGRARNPAGD